MSGRLELDGAAGEGGGQILRAALSLSVATGRPFRMERIRGGRRRPGLRPQHVTAARAAAEICDARLEGAEPGSRALTFSPGPVRPGEYRFSTGGAGSAVLVLQTVLPPLLTASGPSRLVVEGGTHAPYAPPYDFLARAYLPLVERLGPAVDARLDRPGFYPAGGGRLRVRVEPAGELGALQLTERGPERGRRARAVVSALPRHIAERELSVVHAMLRLRDDAMEVVEIPEEEATGPGNAVMIFLEAAHVTEVFTGFGKRGKPAEEVAREASRRALAHLDAEVPVGPHLADQLLLPLALGAGGVFDMVEPTSHARTHAGVIRRFTGRRIEMEERSEGRWRVRVPGG